MLLHVSLPISSCLPSFLGSNNLKEINFARVFLGHFVTVTFPSLQFSYIYLLVIQAETYRAEPGSLNWSAFPTKIHFLTSTFCYSSYLVPRLRPECRRRRSIQRLSPYVCFHNWR